MRIETRKKFNKMLDSMARSYGVDSVDKNYFVATPSIEQTLHDKIVESSEFLEKINYTPVDELKGEKIHGSVTGILGKRTNTDSNDRVTQSALTLDDKGYECFPTEYDINIKYSTIDSWAKFPDLANRFLRYVRKAIAHAKIRTGFLGIHAATETSQASFPNGEDVNKGWIQLLREFNSGSQALIEGENAGQIRLGAAGDYVNLDSLIYDVLQLVDHLHRDGGDLVAIVGSDLLAFDRQQLYQAQGQKPSEKERISGEKVTGVYGGLPVQTAPFFPARGLLITSLDNLSIYYQTGAVRQKIEDNPKRNRIDYFNSTNEDYVIEDETKAATIEFNNLVLPDGAGGWQ